MIKVHIPFPCSCWVPDRCRIFVLRGGEIWKHERAQELLYDGAGIALQSLITAPGSKAAAGAAGESRQAVSTVRVGGECSDSDVVYPCAPEKEVLKRAYHKDSPIEKYLDLPSSDFEEAFALLPQEANLLHPRLMGANFMNERVRLRLPEAPRGWADRVGFDELLAGMQARDAGEEMGRGGGGGRWLRDPGGAARRVRAANLDPRAPLAQLFWQTLLPWNVFPTPSRPTPPPPDWL